MTQNPGLESTIFQELKRYFACLLFLMTTMTCYEETMAKVISRSRVEVECPFFSLILPKMTIFDLDIDLEMTLAIISLWQVIIDISHYKCAKYQQDSTKTVNSPTRF